MTVEGLFAKGEAYCCWSFQAKHTQEGSQTWGVNGETGVLVDMKDLGIWEPLSVKLQTYKTSVEVRKKPGLDGRTAGAGKGLGGDKSPLILTDPPFCLTPDCRSPPAHRRYCFGAEEERWRSGQAAGRGSHRNPGLTARSGCLWTKPHAFGRQNPLEPFWAPCQPLLSFPAPGSGAATVRTWVRSKSEGRRKSQLLVGSPVVSRRCRRLI